MKRTKPIISALALAASAIELSQPPVDFKKLPFNPNTSNTLTSCHSAPRATNLK